MKPYECQHCGKSGVKLFREYQTFRVKLRCLQCTCDYEGVHPLDAFVYYEDGRVRFDIKWSVAAVPDDDGNWWGYCAIPKDKADWWQSLPNGLEER